ncbi:MAG: hypothetical protein IJS60_03950 [Abditibacteriota bacterium]|nr:hypothetical protein [Abditibacteriota bacterium]
MKRLLAVLTILIVAMATPYADGIKLWPQITEGITNEKGRQVMNCVIGEDGLTVTDMCWDSYQVPGCFKRWNIDMGEFMSVPLKDYKFDPSFAGLPVTITVEVCETDDHWICKETYQEILILGGKNDTVEFPKWFSIPTDRLAYDFDENPAWPRDWTLPKGKLALFQGCAKLYQKDIDGVNPWLRFGFTHIGQHAITKGGVKPPREQLGGLFYDNEWCKQENGKYLDGTNPKNWDIKAYLDHSDQESIIIPDFEVPNYGIWGEDAYAAFKRMVDIVRDRHPGLQIGAWGIGPIKHTFRIFDDFDAATLGDWVRFTGKVDEEAAMKYRELYNDASPMRRRVYFDCDLNFGNQSMYFLNNAKPSQLYAYTQEYENSKQLAPNDKDILSTWIQVEFVDNYPLSTYMFKNSKGEEKLAYLKHQVPASQIYALSLFGHFVFDGLHCWDIGTHYTDNPDDWACYEKGESEHRVTVNGVETTCQYYCKYFGFYNYHVLGMWQASQNKDIIEADTKWFMPVYKSSKNEIWREGDDVFPSFVNLHKEPLIRAKLSQNGDELLVVADNPYNIGKETVTLRVDGKEYSFDLAGTWPALKRFKTK